MEFLAVGIKGYSRLEELLNDLKVPVAELPRKITPKLDMLSKLTSSFPGIYAF